MQEKPNFCRVGGNTDRSRGPTGYAVLTDLATYNSFLYTHECQPLLVFSLRLTYLVLQVSSIGITKTNLSCSLLFSLLASSVARSIAKSLAS